MSDVITLYSSDEDVQSPPKKKIKPVSVKEASYNSLFESKFKEKHSSDIVILSDDEIDDSTKTAQNGSTETANHAITVPDVENLPLKNDNSEPIDVNNIAQERNNKGDEIDIINENSSASSSEKENNVENNLPKNSELRNPQVPNTIEIPKHDIILEDFLKICEESILNSQYEHLKDKQFIILRKYFKKCGAKLSESSNFLKLMEENSVRAKKSPATAVISFNEIFQYVKEVVDAESIEVSEEHRLKLKKLEKAIKLLVMRIKQLENAEVNFDDEEDSTYLQLDRYINRLNKVHKKYCEILKKNPYSGRITYEKLDFVDSEYNEINRAISKKYKNNEKFPSYFEMEQYIRKVVAEYKLELSENKIKNESVKCFKKLGQLLQNRRKKELYGAHYLYIRDTEDPASADKSLESTLKQHFVEGQVKIEKICEEFTMKEELGEEAELSEEDSDKSEEDSENEEQNLPQNE